MSKSIFPFSLVVNARRFNPLEGQQGQAPRVLWALMQFKQGCTLYEKVCAVAATHNKDIEEHQETGECQEEKKKKSESC
jgi:hypothetical protein